MFLEGSNCALFVFIYMCTARHRGDAQQIFVEQTDDPNNPDRYLLGCICCVCSVSLWRLMTRSFSRWCPVAWRLAPLSTMQHSLPGEEQRSAWLALALEDFNLFGPQVKISGFKMSPGSCIFFGWWLVFVSTGAHISYGMSLWDLIASYCPTHTGAAGACWNANLGYATLLVAPSPFSEKSKSPIMAHEQGAQGVCAYSCCPEHSLLLPKVSQDYEWYDHPAPMASPHSFLLYLLGQVGWVWEHLTSLKGPRLPALANSHKGDLDNSLLTLAFSLDSYCANQIVCLF